MLSKNIFKNENVVTIQDGKMTVNRRKASEVYGCWFSEKTDAMSLATWCDIRITEYTKWLENCKELKKACQSEIIKGYNLEELKALVKEKESEQVEQLLALKLWAILRGSPFTFITLSKYQTI